MTNINKDKFLEIIDTTPLVSIDLINENSAGNILLGKRVNRPAKDFWFVPGGRIRKNEKIAVAMLRISSAELGSAISIEKTQLLGNYDHIYDDNAFAKQGINTHYVVLAYKVVLPRDAVITHDEQHSEFKWWTRQDLITATDVHQNTKAYFNRS